MRKMIIAAIVLLVGSLSGHCWAANYSDPIDGTFKGIYGSTIAVEVPSLVAKSPVANEDQNGDLSFQFNASTSYKNFNQLTDLKYGDPVRVEYTEDPTSKDKQQMVASIITKIEPVVENNPVATDNPDTASVSGTAPTVTQTVITTTTTKVNQ